VAVGRLPDVLRIRPSRQTHAVPSRSPVGLVILNSTL